MPDDRDYEVGYGKPPIHSRWKEGQSGNRKGSRRGVKKLSTLLHEALQKKVVVVTENGRRRAITKLEAALTQLANRAAQGEHKATQTLLGLMQEIERSPAPSSEPSSFTKDDEQVLQFIRDQLVGVDSGNGEGDEGS
jgi:hypothetical protein